MSTTLFSPPPPGCHLFYSKDFGSLKLLSYPTETDNNKEVDLGCSPLLSSLFTKRSCRFMPCVVGPLGGLCDSQEPSIHLSYLCVCFEFHVSTQRPLCLNTCLPVHSPMLCCLACMHHSSSDQ